MRIGLCGASYSLRNLTADCQQTRNWYPEQLEGLSYSTQAEPKLRYQMCPTPGLQAFSNLGTEPVRGLFEFNGRLFGVNGKFNEIFSNGTNTAYNFLPNDGLPVTFAANNANQLLICSGGQLWLFPLAPGSIVYHDVPTAISSIQIVDGSPQDWYITCAAPPPYTVGSSITFESVGSPLSFVNGRTAPILGIVGNVIHVQLPQSLTANWVQNISSITVTPGASGPTQNTAGNGSALADWINPGNVSSNVSFATALVPTGSASYFSALVGTQFGFAIPDTATIQGIEISFTRKQTQSGHIAKTGAVALQKDGGGWGTPKSGSVYYSSSAVTETWGGSSDLWGLTVSPTDLNDSSFGFDVVVAFDSTELSDTVSLNNFQIKIYWAIETSTIDVTLDSDALYSAGNNLTFDGLTNVPVLNGNTYPIASIAGPVITIGPIASIGSSYSGAETGTTTSRLTHYNAASSGNVLGTVAYESDSPVQVAIGQGPFSAIDFVDGYFVALISNSQKFQISGLEDGTSWDALDIAQVTEFPENIIGMLVDHRQIFFWGNKHYVIYEDTGNSDFPFEPIPGSFAEMGLAAAYSPVRLDQSVFWIGKDERGTAMAWRANGYSPVRVSNHAIEQIWNDYSTVDDAIAYPYQQDGHSFWVVWFPTANATWVYDAATQLWHQRTYYANSGSPINAHLSRCHALAFGKHLVGSRIDGSVYWMGIQFYDDDGQPILRNRIPSQIANEQYRIYHERLQLYMDSGVQLDDVDPQVNISYSDDGGHTWSEPISYSAGRIGQYGYRILANRLGVSRARVYQISCSDAVPWRITDAYVEVSAGLN